MIDFQLKALKFFFGIRVPKKARVDSRAISGRFRACRIFLVIASGFFGNYLSPAPVGNISCHYLREKKKPYICPGSGPSGPPQIYLTD